MNFGLSDDQNEFVERVREFARTRVAPRAASIDETSIFPRDLVAEAAQLGLTGLTIPADAGGAGRDYVTLAAALEEIAAASATLAVILVVHNTLVAEPIAEFGTAAQKAAWLGRLARGEALGAFALSEAQSGSDASHQRTVAWRTDVASAGGGYRLRGEKVWVSGAVAEMALCLPRRGPARAAMASPAFCADVRSGPHAHASPDTPGVHGLGCVTMALDDVFVGRQRGGDGRRRFDVARRRVGRPSRCRAGTGRRPGGARRGGGLRTQARSLRPSHQRVSGDPVSAC